MDQVELPPFPLQSERECSTSEHMHLFTIGACAPIVFTIGVYMFTPSVYGVYMFTCIHRKHDDKVVAETERKR